MNIDRFYLAFIIIIQVYLLPACHAFVNTKLQTTCKSLTSLRMSNCSRRNWVESICSSSVALVTLHSRISFPVNAADNVDYSKIQDLLGPNGGDYVKQYQVPEGGKRPTWLTEPTDEFKESEQKATEFKRKNLLISKQFQSLLSAITTAPDNEGTLIDSLDALRRLVKSNRGLPIGITKEEIVKTCRRRKAKKYWPTTVEVA